MPTDHPDTAPSDLAPAARGTAIRSAEVLVTSPDRNFVTLRITTEDGVVGLGDAHAQRPRAVRGVVPARPRRAAADRPRRAPHRGHLAVPLPLGVLAARAGDHGGDRRGRRGAVGHQGEGRRAAAVPAARRGEPDRDHGVRARQRPGPARAVRLDPARTWSRATGPSGCRPSVPGIDAVYGVAAQPSSSGRYDYEPAQRAPLPAEEDWDTRAYLRHLPGGVRGRAQRVRPRAAAAARRAPPADPDPGGAPRQGPGAVRPVLARGLHARRRTRRRCGWSGSTPPPRWRSARSSTPCGTTRR